MATAGRQLSDGNPLGQCLGQSTTDLIGFYGLATPIVQRTAAAQAAVVDTSGGTATALTGVTTITGTYNSVILANAFATVIALVNELRASMVAVNLIKGS